MKRERGTGTIAKWLMLNLKSQIAIYNWAIPARKSGKSIVATGRLICCIEFDETASILATTMSANFSALLDWRVA